MSTALAYSAIRKAELALAALQGESLPALAAKAGVDPGELARWRTQLEAAFDEGATATAPVEGDLQSALQRQGGSFRAVVDHARVGIYMVDSGLRIVHVNPAALPVFGEIPDLVGRDFDEVIHVLWTPEYADEVVMRFRHTLESGESYQTPERAELRADRGIVEHYEWRIHRIPLPDGTFGVACYFRDASDRVRAREALAESEARYRTLFESIDEGFCVVEMIFDVRGEPIDYRFVEMNPAFEKHTGLHNALGRRIREMVPLHEDHWMTIYGEVATTGQPTRFINEARHLDGRWFDVYAFRLGGAQSRRVAILFNDITERQHAEQALRESVACQRVLVRLGDALRPLADPVRIQAEAARILGEHLQASRVFYAEVDGEESTVHVHAEHCVAGSASMAGVHRMEAFGAEFARNLSAGRTMVRCGGDRPEALAAAGGMPAAALGIGACVTVPLVKAGRLAAFLSMHQSVSRDWTPEDVGLMEEMAERTWAAAERARAEAALRAANDELTRTARQKDEFLAMLAHELRNPLAAIANVVPVLELASGDAQASREWLALLQRQTDLLTALVDDLLDVSRITHGRIELHLQLLDLATLVRRVAEGIRPRVSEQQQELQVRLPDGPIQIEGDPVRLEQIAVNLLTNAVKYTPRGGRVVVALQQRQGEAELSVRDTGVGLAPEAMAHVFDLFTQAEPPPGGAQRGLGIGLTVVKRLVELHQGRVEVHSEGLGKGAEFTVTLPLAVAGASPARPRPGVNAARRRRILLVDDSVDVAAALAHRLRALGHEVIVEHEGLAALATAEEAAPEVILLDLGMPGMDGYELARRLRQSARARSARLAAVTGYGQPRDRERTRDAGFDAHFVKPVDLDLLRAFIERK